MRSVLLLASLLCACTSSEHVRVSAETNARRFADSMGMEVIGVACSGSDSELDGYVSCTLNESNGTRTPIECGYDTTLKPSFLVNDSCKLARPVTIVNQ